MASPHPPEDDHLLDRLKEAVLRAVRVPQVTTLRPNAAEASMRDSVRTTARVRISTALRQLRAAYSFSYEDLQTKTGLSQQLLWDVEYKDRRLTLSELEKLAACFEMTASDLLGIDLE